MINITVVCTNPDDIRLQVTTELTIGEWREVVRRAENGGYYRPLSAFIDSIRSAIGNIEDREVFRPAPDPS